MANVDSDQRKKRCVSRRTFVKGAGAGALWAAATAGAVSFAESIAYAQQKWNHEADVVVVGSGAAASSAALFAHESGGAQVVMLEKADSVGGTTGKSGGQFWIPNNFRMREQGILDSKQDCLRFMARLSYPTLYNAKENRFGIPEYEYSLLETYYDNASPTVDALRTMGVGDLEAGKASYLVSTAGHQWRQSYYDRYAELPEHSHLMGRVMISSEPNGTRPPGIMGGAVLISHFKAAIEKRRIPLLLGHRASRLVLNSKREVIGLEATTGTNQTVTFRARKAVIFGSGGFTANPTLCRTYLRGPIFGGCAVPTNEGDFILIAQAVGAELGNMANAWWGPCVLEQALASRAVPSALFGVPGDSVVQVNCEGRRVGDEKRYYNDRTQVHFYWDPHRMRYPNLIQVMIYDQRCRERFGPSDHFGVMPRPGVNIRSVMTSQTLEGLANVVDSRLAEIENRTGNFRLDADFTSNLRETIARFNQFAKAGVDLDFHRGEFPADDPPVPANLGSEYPNPAMYPIASAGPYYAVLIAGGTLDTKGGPKINLHGQVLDTQGQAISGLYGAGNCIASPAGEGYWSPGGTIGPAMTFGAIAGKQAAKESVKDAA
jgi:succinate dehydrogenase/fumarate reductase flavoprotein subunit